MRFTKLRPFYWVGRSISLPGDLRIVGACRARVPTKFFDDELFVWFAGALPLFAGLLIVAFHQCWSSVAAVMILLFGWILALRGSVFMAAPKLYERADPSLVRYLSCELCSVASLQTGFISPMWVGLPSRRHHKQPTTVVPLPQLIPSRCWVSLTRRMLTLPFVISISLRQHGFCASRQ